ncbi:hypothetical protein [Miltoncostaea marina]|uniref:hypothetical protein n=1 Tax=Miltoncostaea marina TaxID=2843215 RepID=UPI001C3DAD16|nr:hypothetical protein [Miltoncostaea marina]
MRRAGGLLAGAVLALAVAPAAGATAAWGPAVTLTGCGDVLEASLDRAGAADVLLAVRDDCAVAGPSRLVRAARPPAGPWSQGAARPGDAWPGAPAGPLAMRDRRSAAVAPDGTTATAWLADGAVRVATRPPDGARSTRRLAGARGVTRGPVVAAGASGDVLVAWARRSAGRSAVVAADRRPGGAWSPPRTIARLAGSPSGLAAAVDAAGRGTVAWEAPAGRIVAAEHRRGAARWSRPAHVGRAGALGVSGLAVDGAGTAVLVTSGTAVRPGVRAFTRAPGGRWSRPRAVTGAGCCVDALAVGPLGDTVMAAEDGTRLARRPAGGRWLSRPVVADQPATWLRVDAAGDMLAISEPIGSSGSEPVLARTLRAPARPVVRALRVARRGGAAPRVRLALSRPGRVLLTLRRGGGPVVAAAMVTPRRRAVTVALPARLRDALGAGRHALTADTGRSARTVALRGAR